VRSSPADRTRSIHTGTLLEAAGLLFSIVFHWGVTAVFQVAQSNGIDCSIVNTTAAVNQTLFDVDELHGKVAASLQLKSSQVSSNVVSVELVSIVAEHRVNNLGGCVHDVGRRCRLAQFVGIDRSVRQCRRNRR
jgi:hypothetical protein